MLSSCEKTYEIAYELDGGVNSAENPSEYQKGETVKLNFPEKDGYMFLGWYTEPTFENRIMKITEADSDITLYAKWTQSNYVLGENVVVNPPVDNTEIVEPTNSVNVMQIVFIAVGSLCFVAGAVIIVLTIIKKRKN
jgi:uncharacterized repeat protein (TIGR02543 family)